MRLSCLKTRAIQPNTHIRRRMRCSWVFVVSARGYSALAWDQVVSLDNTTVVLIPICNISRQNSHACQQEMVKKCRGCWSRDEIMYEQETYIYVLQSITNDWDYTLSRWSAVSFCDFWASYMYQNHTRYTYDSIFVILLARMLVTRNERDETKTKRGEKDCGMKS